MGEGGHKVTLNVYDLSQGLARQLSMTFLGKAIEGIWHTGLVVYGNEYFFGGGIQQAPSGSTQYGTPVRTVDLGVTHVPQELFEDYLQEISPRYTAETYSLLHHNCNNFSDEVAQFLVGVTIPDYILQLPNEVMSSPMGPLILPMIQRLEMTMRAGAVPQAPQFTPAALTESAKPAPNALTRSASTVSATPARDLPTTNGVEIPSKPNSTDAVKMPERLPLPSGLAAAVRKKANDPLGDARTKVQDEICKEFSAIMATGTFQASEAAALATRRVMERHGQMSGSMSQS